MSDWPNTWFDLTGGAISSFSEAGLTSDLVPSLSWGTGATWPSANRALYLPFIVDQPVTALQMAFVVTAQSGNCDVGIYTEQGVRLVSAGSTAVGTAGAQVINITDTVLNPALYYMAMNVDNTTAAVTRQGPAAIWAQLVGVQQQDVGAVTLPDPATFANPVTAYIPALAIALRTTM